MRHMLVVGLMVLVAPVARGQEVTDTDLDAVAWLAGCWERRGSRSVTLEMWMPPAGGVMLGASRTVAGGVVHETERLTLRAQDGGLIYVADPSGQAETEFTSTDVTGAGFTVENLEHDFPQRIVYRRLGTDSLVARIEGPGPSGTGTRGIEFPMQRVSCTTR